MAITFEVKGRTFELREWKDFTPAPLGSSAYIKDFHRNETKGTTYINLPMVYDCEVSSWYNAEGVKRASVYVWTCIVFDTYVYYGRTVQDFVNFLGLVKKAYDLGDKKRAICYVHNLPYDSHFFLPWIDVEDMFAIDSHSPLSFFAENAFEFKCSLALSNKSLDKIGKEVGVGKVKGFDYTKLRHHATPLTDEEWKYCMFDVIVLYHYIEGQIAENKRNITDIAKTFTGVTRRACRKDCVNDSIHVKYYKECKIKDIEIMRALQQAFQGGYTHSNSANAGYTLENVDSYDLSSDYPSQMVKQKFPITRFRKDMTRTIRDPERYASLIKISITGLKAKTHHSVISTSKIIGGAPPDAVVDNGRLVSTGMTISMWITEMDYIVYKMFYDWDKDDEEIEAVYYAQKGYLSAPYVLYCLKLYEDKTKLKDSEDPNDKYKYKMAKMQINSLYGMSVTSPMRLKWLYEYDGEDVTWSTECKTEQELLDDANKSRTNFLAYQWGVWVTAYARYDLLRTIKRISDEGDGYDEDGRPFDDVVYCDTDSIKILNGAKHKHIFDEFNAEVEAAMKKAIKVLDPDLDEDVYAPKDPHGNPRPLGIFAYEPNEIDKSLPSYRYFKTLGAKRYVFSFTEDWDKPDHFGITIAGLPKRNAQTLVEIALKEDTTPFDLFTDQLSIPKELTGKNIVTYIDSGFDEDVMDYLGNPAHVEERAYIHMEAAPFKMGIDGDFKRIMNKRRRSNIL